MKRKDLKELALFLGLIGFALWLLHRGVGEDTELEKRQLELGEMPGTTNPWV